MRRRVARLWLSVAASAALHAAPLAFPVRHLARQLLPLRPNEVEVQVEVLHEVAQEPAAAEAARPVSAQQEPEAPEPAAAPAPRARRAVTPPKEASPAPAIAEEPVVAEPAVAAEQEPPATDGAEATDAETSDEPAPVPPSVASAEAVPSAPRVAGAVAGASGGAVSGSGSAGRGARTGSVGSAGAGAPAADLTALRSRYLGQLRQRVMARREYPRMARRAGLEGTVCLRISLDASGRVAQVRPTCAAPDLLLEAALRAVQAAAPFGPLPSALGSQLVLDLPVVFQLDAG